MPRVTPKLLYPLQLEAGMRANILHQTEVIGSFRYAQWHRRSRLFCKEEAIFFK